MLDLPHNKFNKFYFHLKAFVIDNKKSLDPLFLFCICKGVFKQLIQFQYEKYSVVVFSYNKL